MRNPVSPSLTRLRILSLFLSSICFPSASLSVPLNQCPLALLSLLISLCPKCSVFTHALSQYPLGCWRYALGLNGCPELSSSQVLRHLTSFFTHLFIPEFLSMGLFIQQQDLALLWTISEVNRTEIIKIACGFLVFCEKKAQKAVEIRRLLSKTRHRFAT